MEGKYWDTLDTYIFHNHSTIGVEEGLSHSNSLKISLQTISHSDKDIISQLLGSCVNASDYLAQRGRKNFASVSQSFQITWQLIFLGNCFMK